MTDFMTAERRLPVVIFNVTSDRPRLEISFWSLSPFNYGHVSSEVLDELRTSNLNQCMHNEVHRLYFGVGVNVGDLKLYSIPLTMSTLLSPVSEWLPNYFRWTTDTKDDEWYQEFFLPLVLVLSMGALAVALAIPFLLFASLVWGVFNTIRIILQKRLRKLIRWTLIRMELGRRWKLERTFPRQHFRKWQEREKYRLPKMFQDSDKSNDDEPQELQRKPIEREVTTTWADHHIESLGFDPDNISWDLVYGDLIGKPKKLHPVARGYVRWLKRQTAAEQENENAGADTTAH